MKKTIALTLFLTLAQAACSTDPSKAVCERADECGYLNVSVERCVIDLDDWYADRLSERGQEECPDLLEGCAERSSCSSFNACMFDGSAYACHPY